MNIPLHFPVKKRKISASFYVTPGGHQTFLAPQQPWCLRHQNPASGGLACLGKFESQVNMKQPLLRLPGFYFEIISN